MAVLSSAAVVLLVILGFLNLGAPRAQRELRADNERVRQLFELNNAITEYWKAHSSLPTGTKQLIGRAYADPVTHAAYEYHPGQGSQYQLCANFTRKSEEWQANSDPNLSVHPAGQYCFQLDAATVMPFPPQSYP